MLGITLEWAQRATWLPYVVAGLAFLVWLACIIFSAVRKYNSEPPPCEHNVIVTHPGARSQNNPHNRDIAVGYCTKCNQRFEWQM